MWNRWLESSSALLRPLPLYLGVYVAFAASAGALYSEMGSSTNLAIAMILVAVGLAHGYRLRKAPRLRGAGLLLGAVITAIAVSITPFGSVEDAPMDERIAFRLVWLIVFLAFGACTDDTALFLVVPSMAMLIASATQGSDAALTGYALVFCLAGIFGLVWHAGLREDSRTAQPVPLKQSFLNQVTLAGLCFLTTATLALLATIPLRLLGLMIRPFAMGGIGYAAHRRIRNAPPTPGGRFITPESVLVGQGPIHPSNDPMLRVKSREQHLFLSRVYTDYTTQGWQQLPNPDMPATTVNQGILEIQPDQYAARWPLVRQDTSLLNQMDVAPAYPFLVKLKILNSAVIPRIDSYGSAMLVSQNPSLSYSAFSRVPPSLESLPSTGIQGYVPPTPNPPYASGRVADLAASLKGSTDIKTAQNIIDYLQSHCTYDLSAPAVPQGKDVVDYFVFQSHVGYCDLFATSAALLLQMDGIPARYCVGYVPGQWDETTHAQIVTLADAHAWVEVFIQGQGWIPIDPTPPGFTGPPSLPVEFRDLLSQLPMRAPGLDFPSVLVMAALFLGALLLHGALPSVLRRRISRQLAQKPGQEGLIRTYWTMERLLSRVGLARHLYETPLEHAQRIRTYNLPNEVGLMVESITRTFVEARYGNKIPAEDHSSTLLRFRQVLRCPDTRKALRSLKESGSGSKDQ